jgi:hypothetical protein
MRFTAIVFALLIGGLATQAHAQCPSNAYFRADADNALGEYGTLKSTLCVAIASQTTRINMNALVIAEVGDASRLLDAVMRQLTARMSCGLFSLAGWEITDVDATIVTTGSGARVRVSATGRDCHRAGGWQVIYEAPLVADLSNNQLRVRVNVAAGRVRTARRGVSVPFVSGSIGNAINEALAQPFDFTSVLPAQAALLNPSVTSIAVTMKDRRLLVRIHAAGRLEKPTADRLLRDAVRDHFVPPVRRWLSPGPLV